MSASIDGPKRTIQFIGWLENAVDILGKIGAIFAGLCLFTMTFSISAATISRYLFNRPWGITEELSGVLLLAVFFMALLYVLVLGRHIRVTIIFDLIPAKIRAYLLIINSLLATAYAGFIVGEGIRLVNQLIEFRVSYLMLPLPEALGAVFIPIGMGFFGLGCLTLLIKQALMMILKSSEVKYKW
jgi:TRAP-type C4-dicarboxylate transport system permease small subunit